MTSKPLSINVDAALDFIEEHLDRRQVNKIQHSFPSPRFWSEKFVPVDKVIEDRQHLSHLDTTSPVNLYIGSPYCIKTAPSKCGYCLFPVEVFAGNAALEVYFDYLKREVEMYQEAMVGQELGAVYFGGGTANLFKAPKYLEMMDLVRSLFPEIKPHVDLTLEGLPQLFSYDKVKAIHDAGFNRLSVGVQQINERLNSFSGRRQSTQQVRDTLKWSKEFGLACNFDVIFGWPQQTVQTMVEDLETLVEWGVYDITHYELNVGGPTDFALNRFHELPSTLSNLEMYRVSSELLKSHGYEQITAYNYRKPGDPNSRPYEEGVTRRFDSMNTVGIGYAAITFFGDSTLPDGRNWSYINCRDLNEYKKAIDAGKFPVECGFSLEQADYQISMIWRNLFGLEIDREEYHGAFDVDVFEQFEGVWTALQEYDFVEVTPQKIKLIGDGPFYTPLVQTLLAEARYSDLRSRMVSEVTG